MAVLSAPNKSWPSGGRTNGPGPERVVTMPLLSDADIAGWIISVRLGRCSLGTDIKPSHFLVIWPGGASWRHVPWIARPSISSSPSSSFASSLITWEVCMTLKRYWPGTDSPRNNSNNRELKRLNWPSSSDWPAVCWLTNERTDRFIIRSSLPVITSTVEQIDTFVSSDRLVIITPVVCALNTNNPQTNMSEVGY